MPVFYVELQNHVDRRDDNVVKIKAKNTIDAREAARHHTRGRFTIGRVMRTPELKRWDYEWWQLLRSRKPSS
jgi:hypothetical protein